MSNSSRTFGQTMGVICNNLWKSLFGPQSRWSAIKFYRTFGFWPSDPKYYKALDILQYRVSEVLEKKAEKYLELCKEQKRLLEIYEKRKLVNEVVLVTVPAVSVEKKDFIEDARRLTEVNQLLQIFKNDFWSSWHLAKGFGFKVKARAKDYISPYLRKSGDGPLVDAYTERDNRFDNTEEM